MAVPYFKPSIDSGDTARVVEAMNSGWLTSGPSVAEFERQFAAATNASYAVALNSCTAALHLALLALEVGPSDEVLVPTMTFAATAEVVLAVGATPVLVDCDEDTLAIDVEHARSKINWRTRAIIPMHYGGDACDMAGVFELQRAHPDLLIIEDAAHAFPANHALGTIGSLGDATCFSFYANKTITTGEGGMLTTEDESIANQVRQLSLHGLSKGAWDRFETRSAWDYDIERAGWKYNMTDVAAALGLEQLKKANEFAAARRTICAMYDERFANEERISPRTRETADSGAAHLYVIRVDCDRNALIQDLAEQGVGTSVHYRPLHMHSLYEKSLGLTTHDYPRATRQFSKILSLPVFPSMTEAQVDEVSSLVRRFVDR